MPHLIRYIIHVIVPLLFGGSIYLLFRSEQLYMFRWVKQLGMNEQLLSLRLRYRYIGEMLPDWALHSLPDALWLYAFASFMFLLWEGTKATRQWLWCIIPILVAIVWEIGQAFQWWAGTFDWWDIIAYTIVINLMLIRLIKK